MSHIDNIETDHALHGLGRTACLAYQGAREIGSTTQAIMATVAVVLAMLMQTTDDQDNT